MRRVLPAIALVTAVLLSGCTATGPQTERERYDAWSVDLVSALEEVGETRIAVADFDELLLTVTIDSDSPAEAAQGAGRALELIDESPFAEHPLVLYVDSHAGWVGIYGDDPASRDLTVDIVDVVFTAFTEHDLSIKRPSVEDGSLALDLDDYDAAVIIPALESRLVAIGADIEHSAVVGRMDDGSYLTLPSTLADSFNRG
jgi:hypothetical protein